MDFDANDVSGTWGSNWMWLPCTQCRFHSSLANGAVMNTLVLNRQRQPYKTKGVRSGTNLNESYASVRQFPTLTQVHEQLFAPNSGPFMSPVLLSPCNLYSAPAPP